MDQLIGRFSAQLREALEIGERASIRKTPTPIDKIVVIGMGGSGIGGDFVASMIRSSCAIPYMVSKGYDLPAYVDEKTLVIASSYSGNTEETLSAFGRAVEVGAQIKCVASGGKLKELAQKHDLDFVQLPDDWPSPRACLGFSFVQQLFILSAQGLVDDSLIDAVRSAADLLDDQQEDIKTIAQRIATQIFNKTAIIYIEDRMEPVAVRLRQQINENAKTLCWHHVIPEMNHNELVGWKSRRDDLAVLMFRNADDSLRNQKRMDICFGIMKDLTSTCIRIDSKGETFIEKQMYLVHLGDWISWYLSELRHVDSIEVDVIDYLKNELAQA